MPATAFSIRKRPRPLVDTSLLFPFLVWRFSEIEGIRLDTPLLAPITSDHLRKALLWYLDIGKPIQTSPHVIAEIHGLLKSRARWKGARLESFWEFAKGELSRLGLQEMIVTVAEMELKTLRALGPTDAAILALGKRAGTVVLAEDGPLRAECARQEISVLSCSAVFAEWQKSQI